MKPIKITEANKAKLQAAIDLIQPASIKARKIDSDDLLTSMFLIEEKLRERLCKKDWAGLSFIVDYNHQSFPSTYKGTPESTLACLTRSPSGWNLTDVWRGTTRSRFIMAFGFNDKAEQLAAFAQDNF